MPLYFAILFKLPSFSVVLNTDDVEACPNVFVCSPARYAHGKALSPVRFIVYQTILSARGMPCAESLHKRGVWYFVR